MPEKPHAWIEHGTPEEFRQNILDGVLKMPLLEPLDDYGDLMLLADWVNGVRSNFFTDYDGHGYWATKGGHGADKITPSDFAVGRKFPPAWATHVVWFNR